jgi:hypothetical protein
MNTSQHSAAVRRLRTAVAAALTAGAGLAGLLGVSGVAHASTVARPDGYVVYTQCTGVSGSISYSPGMRTSILKNVNATLTGTTSGCDSIFTGTLSGTGTITAALSGKADVSQENFSGTFVINWPASSGFNPSDGTLSVTDSNGTEVISGTVTSGFETGSEVAMTYVINGQKGKGTKARPVISQTYVNAQPLTLSENVG